MSEIFSNNWFMIPLISICVAMVIYFGADKIVEKFLAKTFQKKEDIKKYMSLIGMDVNERKINIMILLSSWGLGGLFFIAIWPNVMVGLLLGIVISILGLMIPPLVFKYLYEKHCDQFVAQMVDGLTIMANGIKSGSNPMQTMQRVMEIMPNPMASEFGRVVAQVQIGQSFEQALIELGERIPRPDVQMFVTSINILKETGGNLSETFQTISTVIRERQKLEQKIKAMTAQGIMQGLIVSLMPFALMIMFFFVDPGYIKPMFSTTLGWVLIFIMLALQITGGIIIRKVVTIKV